jgi:hypothetical protein
MKINVNIAANAQGISLGKYIDYQNAVDKVEQVRIITGKTTTSIRLLHSHVIDEIIMRFEAAIKVGSNNFERKVDTGLYHLGFIPNLQEMTFGEYIDLDTACTDLYKNETLNGDAALKMMCILYRPVKVTIGKYYDIDKYNPNDVRKYIDAVKQLSLDHVFSVLLFFSSLEIELYSSSLEYLAKEITEIVKEMTPQQHQTA